MSRVLNLKKRVFVLSIIATVLITTIFLTPQVLIVVNTKVNYSKDKTPELYVTPVLRHIKFRESDTDLSCNGLSFKSPWGKTIESKSVNEFTVYKFIGDKSLIIRNKSEISANEEILKDLSKKEKGRLLEIFDEDTFKSDFEYRKFVLQFTPDNIKLGQSFKENKNIFGLLSLKQISIIGIGESQKGIYIFDTGEVKGFQYGQPSISNQIILQIYDEDNKDYIMSFSKNITQCEIDSIIESMRIGI